jgi:hypothetical protein
VNWVGAAADARGAGWERSVAWRPVEFSRIDLYKAQPTPLDAAVTFRQPSSLNCPCPSSFSGQCFFFLELLEFCTGDAIVTMVKVLLNRKNKTGTISVHKRMFQVYVNSDA